MSRLFTRTRRDASARQLTSSQSSEDRASQGRKHSEIVKNNDSHRPKFLNPQTWHKSRSTQNLTNGEAIPELPKSSKKNGTVNTIFSRKSKSHTTEDEDSDEEEFWCIGEGETGKLKSDGIPSNKDRRLHQKSSINSLGRSEPKPKSGQLQPRVSTKKTRPTYKPTSSSIRSSSTDSSTAALSVASSNRSISPYTDLSAARSLLHPRSIDTVHSTRRGEKANSETGSSGYNSDVSEYRGRDVRNACRENFRGLENQYPKDHSFGPNPKDKIRSNSHTPKNPTNSSNQQESHRPTEERSKRYPQVVRTARKRLEIPKKIDYDSHNSRPEAIRVGRQIPTHIPTTGGAMSKPPKPPNDAYKGNSRSYYTSNTISDNYVHSTPEPISRRPTYHHTYERAYCV